jgi:2-phosphosulfolactate phosphatase
VIFVTTNGTRATAAAPAGRVLLGCLRNAPAVARHLEASETDSIYLTCADGRFALDDFFGTAAILSSMFMEERMAPERRSWTALDFMERHRNVAETLQQGRMGRWFAEHRMETFEFVADVGASDLVPEVVSGRLFRAGEPDSLSASVSTPPSAACQHLSKGLGR